MAHYRALARALRLFLLPTEVPIDPAGWVALRYRRRICHSLNALLDRLGQPPILHSRNFHPVDLDVSTITLGLSLLWASALLAHRAALGVSLPKFPWRLEVVDVLASGLALPVTVLTVVALALVFIQQAVVVRRFPFGWQKFVTLTASLGVVLATTLSLARVVGPGILARRVAVECVQSYDAPVCGRLIQAMASGERKALVGRLRLLHQELVKR